MTYSINGRPRDRQNLVLVHSDQPEAIRALMVEHLRAYPLPPLQREVVLVQSNGIAQWLKLALAADAEAGGGGGLGIAAGFEFALPARFIWRVYRAVLGGQVPETSPFDKERLVWRLLRVLPEVSGDARFAPLARFLTAGEGGEGDTARRLWQLASELADLYDQYQVYRADWLNAWASGEAVLIDARGTRQPLDADRLWQAALWQRLCADVVVTTPPPADGLYGGRAEVHAAFLAAAAARGDDAAPPPGLPPRVLVFGVSALPRQAIEVLDVLARWCEVLVGVHNPCRHYWGDVVDGRELLRRQWREFVPRDGRAPLADELLHLNGHPLLVAWGRQGRDYIAMLDEQPHVARVDLHFSASPAEAAELPLLGQIQHDICELNTQAEIVAAARRFDPAVDGSLRFEVAHSALREVEILHDRLLAAFAADPTLTPRDIIVMVPDVNLYAPLVHAVFGRHAGDDPRRLPYSLADCRQQDFDPLLRALDLLLGLPDGRLTLSDMLALLDVPALRARFALGEGDVATLRLWLDSANVRWALHGEQRARLGLPVDRDAAPHTWLFGLRRLLLGYAIGFDSPAWQDIAADGEAGGLAANALGQLALLLDRLDAVWREFAVPAPAEVWCVRLRALLHDFFAPDDDRDAFTLARLDEALDDWADACREACLTQPLPLAVIGPPWLATLDSGGLGQRFFAGAVLFATLMPMRAIPFRRVYLLGMSDDAYPRRQRAPDFDLMAQDYRPGDRSRREDDRYLFLEALLSAREHLSVSWVGRSIVDNSVQPPAVLVSQLRDHLASGWRLADDEGEGADSGARLLAALTREHPLQPFSPRYFPQMPDPRVDGWYSYAREWTQAATPPRYAPLPPLPGDSIDITTLSAAVREPVKTFFGTRLGVRFNNVEEETLDTEPFALDGLQRWKLVEELLRDERRLAAQKPDGVVDEVTAQAVMAARLEDFARRGELPGGAFGERTQEALADDIAGLANAYRTALRTWPQAVAEEFAVEVSTTTSDGRVLRLADRLHGLRQRPSAGAAPASFTRIGASASHLVDTGGHYKFHALARHWVEHLAWQLACPQGVTSVLLSPKGEVTFAPLAAATAQAELEAMLHFRAAALCEPLPLELKTAVKWLQSAPRPKPGDDLFADDMKGEEAVRKTYEGDDYTVGERDRDATLARAFPDYAALRAAPRFAELARAWLPHLLKATPASASKKTGYRAKDARA